MYNGNEGDYMRKTTLYRILIPILVFLFKLIFNPKVIGKENIVSSGPLVIAGTHTNILDPILILSQTKRTVHFLAKKELIEGPLGFIFKRMAIIPVDRSIKDKSVIPVATDFLDKGEIVGIFPEGTTEKGRGLLPFKIGAVKMASNTGSPIIPFAITGKYRPFINKLTIVFGKPYKIKNKNDLTTENEILRNTVIELIKKGENYGKNK